MQVDYSKVTEEELPTYNRAMANAMAYMNKKYPQLCYCGLKVKLSSYDGQAHFHPKDWSIKIHSRHILHFYTRKNCGLTTPRKGIEVPIELEATITIIHELTHYAQGVLGKRVYSEIDTTKNSIEYLLMYHPDIYKKLVKSDKVYRRGYLVKNKTKRVKPPIKTILETILEKANL